MSEWLDILGGRRVMPVLVVKRLADAAPLAGALAEGGLTAVEVTLRTPAALQAMAAMKEAAPGLRVGAGTVRRVEDVAAAAEAGADFLVSPGATPALAAALQASGLPALPGAATASEALVLAELGFRALKFFPAEAMGGAATLKALAGPLPELSFCPTGGVTPEKAGEYLASPNVFCIGGTWIAPEALQAADDWNAIAKRAAEAARL